MKMHKLVELDGTTRTHKEVVTLWYIRFSWQGTVIGSVKFHASSVELHYFDCVYFVPLSCPLTDVEGSTTHHPDNWKYSVIGRWLVTGKELL